MVPRHLDKVQEGVEPPPHGVPAVVPSVLPPVQQVGDEAVSEGARVAQDDVPGLRQPAGDEEETSERDEGVPTPGPHVAGGEVGQPGRQAGRVAAGRRGELGGERREGSAGNTAGVDDRALGQQSRQLGALSYKC